MSTPDQPQQDPPVDGGTHQEEQAEAKAAHRADRPPTAEEAAAAEANELDPAVGERFSEMAELGANVKGEGEVP